ncbi:unnamed protein product [Gongylonema pulchrum]|uniref:Kynureninase n=1 Tax=Gongylonema pulchrum TaxID=637853 RepID=A0A183CXB0_9BILA|nr:unnamed protein product [Gongylonema pulchrum]
MFAADSTAERIDSEGPSANADPDKKIDLSSRLTSFFSSHSEAAEKLDCPFKPPKSKRMEILCHLQRVAQEIGVSDLTSCELAEALDDADPLKYLRNEFFYPKMKTLPHVDLSLVNPDDDSIYMCGNSLGLMPKRTKLLMDEQFLKWANMGVFGHFHEPFAWAHSDESVLDGIAKLVGAERSEVAIMNSLTVNLHILLRSGTKFSRNGKHSRLITMRSSRRFG